MRVPRDLSGSALAASLRSLGYAVTRQTGSHMRLTTQQNGEHHVTVPNHECLRIGTLAGIIAEIAVHFDLDRKEILRRIVEK